MIALLVASTTSLAGLWQEALADFANFGSLSALTAFATVVLLDVALAGDNAVIVGSLASGLPVAQRRRVILIGVLAALVLRIVFAVAVLYGLENFKRYGLVLAGGLLLLWVAWKMYRELRASVGEGTEGQEEGIRSRSFLSAAWAVAVADVSMSLDNVLAVAGAARQHPGIMVLGLILSVALMGLAANIIAGLIERYRWIAFIGLAIILWVAGKMIYDGLGDLGRAGLLG
ncbi:YjbE family putative metal transport protein [Flavisphingomonas formosensis]|uniref:YjbE family putative metal transport protein n=1 Tax=Flavisphingomonas formosensis TaxID=861534 RepID=UPI0012F9577A|nr:YjbE family putative metal transport protein [Sphingomonas formosensis]